MGGIKPDRVERKYKMDKMRVSESDCYTPDTLILSMDKVEKKIKIESGGILCLKRYLSMLAHIRKKFIPLLG